MTPARRNQRVCFTKTGHNITGEIRKLEISDDTGFFDKRLQFSDQQIIFAWDQAEDGTALQAKYVEG